MSLIFKSAAAYEAWCSAGSPSLKAKQPTDDQVDNAHRADSSRHEAGHAVVAVIMGLMPREAVVNETGGGHVKHYAGRNVRQRIVGAMAGSLAACGTLEDMSDCDRRNVTKALSEYKGDRAAMLADCERSARFKVERYAVTIERVAEALHERGKLYGHEVIEIVARHRPVSLEPVAPPAEPTRLPIMRF
jgi:hypothetical protein